MDQTDVKSFAVPHARLGGGSVALNFPCRLKGIWFTPSTAADITVAFRDGSAAGDVLLQIAMKRDYSILNQVPEIKLAGGTGGGFYIPIPQNGIRVETSLFVVATGDATGLTVTLFYGGPQAS